MKLVTFTARDGKTYPGALHEPDNLVIGLNGAGFHSALDVIAAGVTETKAEITYPFFKLDEVRLRAPLLNPPRIFAIGLNYREHAMETGKAVPATPVVFFKLRTAIIGPGDPIVLPVNSAEPDYEAELAFVIGMGGYRIAADEWRRHVYGYTIVNDVSARDVQRATSQWSLSKSFPTFCPMGPAIVTAGEIPDPHALAISLAIDGQLLQSSNTRELIFKIPVLIEYLSSITPLLPGDIVSTGTPSGVGVGRTPRRWLRPGETVTITVEGLGSLTNPVVAE
ncbi:MAG: fumarylacetoacetate hydrolase family protein [Terracidiphilus sp.]|jgi:2-keto-4-pentenoate hydratase/2-oxohepta-3-ene-1,7-dioic acid hydratase in catechol pathway